MPDDMTPSATEALQAFVANSVQNSQTEMTRSAGPTAPLDDPLEGNQKKAVENASVKEKKVAPKPTPPIDYGSGKKKADKSPALQDLVRGYFEIKAAKSAAAVATEAKPPTPSNPNVTLNAAPSAAPAQDAIVDMAAASSNEQNTDTAPQPAPTSSREDDDDELENTLGEEAFTVAEEMDAADSGLDRRAESSTSALQMLVNNATEQSITPNP